MGIGGPRWRSGPATPTGDALGGSGRGGFRERLVGVAVHEVGNHGIVEDPGDDPFGDAVTGNLDDAVEIRLVDELDGRMSFSVLSWSRLFTVAGIPSSSGGKP